MRIVLLLIIVSLSGVAVWFIAVKNIPGARSLGNALLGGDEIVLNGVRIVEKKFNKPTLEIIAAKSILATDDSETRLERFTLVSHSDRMKTLTLSAEKGRMITKTKDVIANGSVVIRDGGGRALLTDSLVWDESRRLISTKDQVRVFGHNYLIKAKGMVVYVDEEVVEFLSDVHATFEPIKTRDKKVK